MGFTTRLLIFVAKELNFIKASNQKFILKISFKKTIYENLQDAVVAARVDKRRRMTTMLVCPSFAIRKAVWTLEGTLNWLIQHTDHGVHDSITRNILT